MIMRVTTLPVLRWLHRTIRGIGRSIAAITILLLGAVVWAFAPGVAVSLALAGTIMAASVWYHLLGPVRPFVGAFALFALFGIAVLGLAIYVLSPIQTHTAKLARRLIDLGNDFRQSN